MGFLTTKYGYAKREGELARRPRGITQKEEIQIVGLEVRHRNLSSEFRVYAVF
jgi:hypothetical protein